MRVNNKGRNYSRNIRGVLTTYIIFILLSLWVPIVDSSVAVLDIVPDSPEQGDMVSFSFRADPLEELMISIAFSAEVHVTDGLYDFFVDDIRIPSSSNMFSVSVGGVSDLHVSLEMPFSITETVSSTDGLAFISAGGIPEGVYDVRIHGPALDGVSKVYLNFTAEFTVHTDKDGLYEYQYDTKGMPAGVFTVDVDGVKREIKLLPREKRWTEYIFPYGMVLVLIGIFIATYFLYKRGYISIEMETE